MITLLYQSHQLFHTIKFIFNMTFLNPLNLWFLIFLSIPIIFHLLNRHKNKEEDFSSVALIKELKKLQLKGFRLNRYYS